MRFAPIACLALLTATLAFDSATAKSSAAAAGVILPGERAAAQLIRADRIRGAIRFLASDLLEGRGPATRGDWLAQAYIAAQLEGLGLEPAAPGGGFFQPFDIVGILTRNPKLAVFTRGEQRLVLSFKDDFIAFSGVQAPRAEISDAEIVFVGYGIRAPEYRWDDYKGADLRGKVLLMLNNDPEDDAALFAGKTRLYYGRWDYKYEMAQKLGAAGAIVIHTDASAGYKWQVVQTSWTGEQFSVPEEPTPLQVKAWATEEASRKLARLGGQDLDSLRDAAKRRDFRPVPLGVRLSLSLENSVSRKQTANVIARLPGRDPELGRQAVLYTAHHDHLGTGEGDGDQIYNGARDNASGVAAMLGIAEAFAALEPVPRRSVYFAAVAAEEQGLLGSQFLAQHPPLEAGRIAANINIDSLNIWGPTRDLTLIGLGKSDLDDSVEAVLAAEGRHVVPDQSPDKGFFYRSDQFSLAKIGVPAAYFEPGTEVIGRPEGFGKQAQQAFEDQHYHQPSDELTDAWNLDGAVLDVRFFFYMGAKLANDPALPAWRPGDEFQAARTKALAAVKK